MVSKPNIGQCGRKDTGPQKRCIVKSHLGWRGKRNPHNKGFEGKLRRERCGRKDTGLQEGWIVRSHISWRWERNPQ